MPKVSVIIPVYNAEEYLRECLDSVINQTLKDIEIICIDDCSTDNSSEILKEYADKDNRIILMSNEGNSGQSISRNNGLKAAKGEYIQFVDSDDYIVSDALECFYKISKDNDLDALKSNVVLLRNEPVKLSLYKNTDVVKEGIKIFSEIMLNSDDEDKHIKFSASCNCFVKSKFIQKNKITFYENIIYEDNLFEYHILINAKRCMCVNEYKYVYRIRKNSTMTVKHNSRHIYSMLTVINEIFKYKNYDEYMFKKALFVYLESISKRAKLDLMQALPDRKEVERWGNDIYNLYDLLISDIFTACKPCNLKKLSCYNNVYIYGAGVACKELLNYIESSDVEINISGIVVTNKSENKSKVFGYRVYGINEITDKNALFLIAAKGYENEIEMNLKRLGYDNALIVT